jgi:hypothetical protein
MDPEYSVLLGADNAGTCVNKNIQKRGSKLVSSQEMNSLNLDRVEGLEVHSASGNYTVKL